MSRPLKNNCDYFPHDNNMRNHVKVRAIRNKFANGYAIWSMLLEFLTGSDGNTFEKTPLQMELLSGDFGVSVAEISDAVDYCIKLELLFEKDGWVYSESLNERLAPVYEKRGKSKQLSAKQQRVNGKFTVNNTDSTVVSVTETPQSKVNKKKENNNNNTLFDFLKNLIDLGVDEEIASDWMKVRKTKKATNTKTAFKNIVTEINKSGLSANECIKISVIKNWTGFNASWLKPEQTNSFIQRPANISRYESWENGVRKHNGVVVPLDAPPCPDNNHRWSTVHNKWTIHQFD